MCHYVRPMENILTLGLSLSLVLASVSILPYYTSLSSILSRHLIFKAFFSLFALLPLLTFPRFGVSGWRYYRCRVRYYRCPEMHSVFSGCGYTGPGTGCIPGPVLPVEERYYRFLRCSAALVARSSSTGLSSVSYPRTGTTAPSSGTTARSSSPRG